MPMFEFEGDLAVCSLCGKPALSLNGYTAYIYKNKHGWFSFCKEHLPKMEDGYADEKAIKKLICPLIYKKIKDKIKKDFQALKQKIIGQKSFIDWLENGELLFTKEGILYYSNPSWIKEELGKITKEEIDKIVNLKKANFLKFVKLVY